MPMAHVSRDPSPSNSSYLQIVPRWENAQVPDRNNDVCPRRRPQWQLYVFDPVVGNNNNPLRIIPAGAGAGDGT